MDTIFNQQWLNRNSLRAYPLADIATKTDLSGTITLPDDFLVAMYFPVHAGVDVDPERFFLRQLGIFPTGFNIVLAYDDDSDDPPLVAATNIARAIHSENRSYALPGSGDFDDSNGKVVIGQLDNIDDLPAGLFLFDRDGGKLDTDVIRPQIRGISSITLVNGNDRSDPLTGDIELVAGENMRLVPVVVGGQDPQIVMSAIEGEGLTEDCVCADEEEAPPIRMINGIVPDSNGNFSLIDNDCIEITPRENGLELEDTCSSPCCGCEELEALETQVARLGDGAITLQNLSGRLASEVAAMNLNVLGSRLSDRTCKTCD